MYYVMFTYLIIQRSGLFRSFIVVKSTESSLSLFLLSLLSLSSLFFGFLVDRDQLPPCSQRPDQVLGESSSKNWIEEVQPEKLHDEREVIMSPSDVFNPPLSPEMSWWWANRKVFAGLIQSAKSRAQSEFSNLLFSSSASIISILAISEAWGYLIRRW